MKKGLKTGIIVIVVMVLAVAVFKLPLDNGVRALFDPLGSVLTRAGTGLRQQAAAIKGGASEQELRDMRGELTRAQLRLVELDRLREENRELRQELSFARSTDHDSVVADIVNYQPDPTRSLVRINVGSAEGVEADMPVVSDGALVGVTYSVTRRTADVMLLGDTDFRALALVSGKNTPGVVKGQIGDGITMEQLPRDGGVQAGDLVVTSGLDGVYPRGILIGSITSVSEAAGSVFLVAQIDSAAGLRQKHVVTVIRRD